MKNILSVIFAAVSLVTSADVESVIAERTAAEKARGAGKRGWIAWSAERNQFFPTQNLERVARIASFLSENAFAPGDPTINRGNWDGLAATSEGIKRIKAAEKVLAEPIAAVPPESFDEYLKTGKRECYSNPKAKCERNINTLVYGEALENKGRFIAKIAGYIDAICNEPSWVAPFEGGCSDRNKTLSGDHYIDLTASRTAVCVATAVSWFRNKLPEQTRNHAMEMLRCRIFNTFLKDSRRRSGNAQYYNWWMPDRFNWSAVCHNGCVSAITAVEDDRMLRAEAIESAERLMAPSFLSGFLDDGYCEEGMGYWNFGFGNFIVLSTWIRLVTDGKVDFCRDFPRAKLVANFGSRYLMNKTSSPPFADGNGAPDKTLLAIINSIWPDLYAKESFNVGFMNGEYWNAGIRGTCRKTGEKGASSFLPKRDWFVNAGVLIARTGELSFAIKGGSNGDRHNHDDAGSYVINIGSSAVAGDPGNENYTSRTFSRRRYESPVLNSYAHPVPRIGGMLQGGGPAFGAVVKHTEFTDAKDTVVYDLSGAYPAKAPIVKLIRTAVFDRATETVTIVDEAEFAAPVSFETPVIAWNKPIYGEDRSKFLLPGVGNKRKLECEVTVSGGEWETTDEFIANPGRTQPHRVAVRFKEPVSKATVSVSYHLR